ncbi:unnamed protein product (macronuclear) [Paramecium tetraurelia]|uniref:Fatty acyl-CoA reductase n=1 Tax=Paramecium tetraurelia TaxID=5888 RepID=A0CFE9_PARTE|nr:uncharacterized protein GSPATT00037955001 [Paramecium tetraurelia]CAK69516.1 unnamed protein product [Paramecium tetraurelia]|eukprot:XP_001436913.1 hypothetical protein (macronuclear) [Paramecium tetraurelia strain d4-2]
MTTNISCLNFYKGKSLLVSGCTGFVAKVILEKILRVLEVKRVYVLVRAKKGQSVTERFNKEIINSQCFDRIRKQKGADFQNFIEQVVKPVDGDLIKPHLGLSKEVTQELIENVNIIINSAASVDFNSPIKVALEINYYGVQKVLELAKQCKHLENFIHVSTAYVNSDKFGFIEEKIYHPQKDVESFVSILYRSSQNFDEKQQKLALDKFPNTYTFTKNLAEQMLAQLRPPNMQITIVRPTIVGCSFRDPIPGWIDNLVGGAAVIFFAGIGLVKIYKGKENLITDQVPVDFVSDMILVAGAYEANKNNFQIYHCGTSARNPAPWKVTKDTCFEYWNANPPSVKVSPCTIEINNNLCYYRYMNFKRKMGALALKTFADTFGNPSQKKNAGRYLKVIDKADTINKTFKHFNRNEWVFSQENVLQLMNCLSRDEQGIFLLDVTEMEWRSYMMTFHYGLQKFILKENVQPPVDEEPTDLLRSWKSGNFTDLKWIVEKQKLPVENKNYTMNGLFNRQRAKL